MDLEIYSLKSPVPGVVIRYTKDRIKRLYRLIKVISLAEVRFRETDSIENSKVCTVSFVVSGILLSVECMGDNYMAAAQKALDAITGETKLHITA